MKNAILIIGVFSIMFVASVSATIINVPDDYPTIQEGIDASTNEDTVLVQSGTYVENINFNGHNVVLGSLFLTTGDTSYISSTIIDGDSLDTVVKFWSEESTAALIGFTIQNGYADAYGGGVSCRYSHPVIANNIIKENSTSWAGGGIFCWSGSNPTITNNIVSNNSAVEGGGLWSAYSHPTITNNIVSNNSAVEGGGLWITNSHPTITNNIVSNNSAVDGGGLWLAYSYPMITNNLISNNSATDGGGFWIIYSHPTITNNIVSNNSATDGGGLWLAYSYPPTTELSGNTIIHNSATTGGGITFRQCNEDELLLVEGNTIARNTASSFGGGIFSRYSYFLGINNTISENSSDLPGAGLYLDVSSPSLVNTIFWANDTVEISVGSGSWPEIDYCDIQDTLWSGEGNISIDPLFRDAENGDFHLMSTECGDPYDSPCIDAGDPFIFDNLLDCSWGLGMERSDMGAYGGQGIHSDLDDDYDMQVPSEFIASQNYPNPFNAQTKINYILPVASHVTIEIYDLLGRRIGLPVDDYQDAGYHAVTWDAKDQSSGLYFYKIQAGEFTETKKMLLLK